MVWKCKECGVEFTKAEIKLNDFGEGECVDLEFYCPNGHLLFTHGIFIYDIDDVTTGGKE